MSVHLHPTGHPQSCCPDMDIFLHSYHLQELHVPMAQKLLVRHVYKTAMRVLSTAAFALQQSSVMLCTCKTSASRCFDRPELAMPYLTCKHAVLHLSQCWQVPERPVDMSNGPSCTACHWQQGAHAMSMIIRHVSQAGSWTQPGRSSSEQPSSASFDHLLLNTLQVHI